MKFVCGHCPKVFPFPGTPFDSEEELRSHMREIHRHEAVEVEKPVDAIDLRYIL